MPFSKSGLLRHLFRQLFLPRSMTGSHLGKTNLVEGGGGGGGVRSVHLYAEKDDVAFFSDSSLSAMHKHTSSFFLKCRSADLSPQQEK